MAVDVLYEPLVPQELNESRPDISASEGFKDGPSSDFSKRKKAILSDKKALPTMKCS
ncbi:hypothetical protein [Pseudomonas sp. RIT-PI-o]|uniref:hypothetical protein n=1 Tax=Pseudomonas sp. RIT-PI-o TaxID=1690246 RepID=UPI000AD2725C|nr:hypothetical protein [Pseudomonas sp. RIT-PI-o]